MAEWIAGKGTTAMSIIGTILGSIGTLGNGTGLLGVANNNNQYVTKEMFDHMNADTQLLAEKDSQIAELKANQQMDAKVLDLYKYCESQFKSLREEASQRWSTQMVVNANVNSGMNVLNSQANDTATTLGQITKTAVPSSAICNFNSCNCNGDM